MGTVVESVDPKASFTQSFGTVEDLVRVAATEFRAVEDVRTVTLDRAAARHLQAPVKSEWLVFSGARCYPADRVSVAFQLRRTQG
ncbi:hypothetical protein [Cupriavidus basilensis]|uniref:hypothetical protein n=1 Tax=Cupriavidus basilensis TaxID=68895 RepID=UPI0023E7D39D|nr:hypothetical protein [Cupriavidus basilensis]MDF3885661.1 hypothetical protein [Cupriavidus basilensis]